jgi:hypothetical protein
MAVKRFIERVSTPFAGAVVDRDKGVIRGVKLCGGSSANGREYPPEVFRRDVRKYEGAAVYADHGRERSVDRKLGWIESPRVDADGTPRGDAHLLRTHPLYERVMEAAERNPALFGFSHVALCETSTGADGRERVEELRAIESVDLVAEPATTKGLFEGRGADVAARTAGTATIRELAAWIARRPRSTTRQILAVKRLAEMDDGTVGDAPAVAAMPAEDAEPEDAVTGGFRAALMSVIERALAGDLDRAAALKRIKTLLAAHGDAMDGCSDDSEPEAAAAEERLLGDSLWERPTSPARHQLARRSETADRSDAIPEGGKEFARWVAE